MPVSDRFIRFARYYKSKGPAETFRHSREVLKRSLFDTKYVLFSTDLGTIDPGSVGQTRRIDVVCRKTLGDFTERELQEIYRVRDQRIATRHFEERYAAGAWLWLARYDDAPAGFVWTMVGHSIEHYFMPLGARDVHFFDNEIFARYRGRGINPELINHVLSALKSWGLGRAFIETRGWNKSELKSLARTHFRQIAVARKYHLLGRNLTLWYPAGNARAEK